MNFANFSFNFLPDINFWEKIAKTADKKFLPAKVSARESLPILSHLQKEIVNQILRHFDIAEIVVQNTW